MGKKPIENSLMNTFKQEVFVLHSFILSYIKDT